MSSITKELLNNLYWKQWLSTREIAKIIGKCQATVRKIMFRAGIPLRSNRDWLRVKIDPQTLKRLYWGEKMTIIQIAEKFGVSAWTVHQRMIKSGIPRRENGEVALKHPKPPFSGDSVERAYMLGIRDDLSAQWHGKRVRMQIGTTHPAMLKLFRTLFNKYAHIGMSSYCRKKKTFQWHVHADLDVSFSFLMKKPRSVETEIFEKDSLFLAFLAGYVDAEGSFIISHSYNSIRFIFRVCSQNVGVLRGIYKKLLEIGYRPALILEAKKGTKKGFSKLNEDYWRLELCRKHEVLQLVQSLPIKHQEKERMRQLMLEIRDAARWSDVRDGVRALHAEIDNEVKQCTEEAASVYHQNHVAVRDRMKFKRASQY